MEKCSDIGAATTLQELYKDNTLMLVDHDHIQFFIQQIQKLGQDAGYLRFLCSIVYCSRQAMSDRQELVRELLLQQQPNLLLKVIDTRGEISVIASRPGAASRVYAFKDLFSSSQTQVITAFHVSLCHVQSLYN